MRKPAKENAQFIKIAAHADAIMLHRQPPPPAHAQPVRLRSQRRPALQRLQCRAQRRHTRRLLPRLDALRATRHRADGGTARRRRHLRPASARRPAAAVSLAGPAVQRRDLDLTFPWTLMMHQASAIPSTDATDHAGRRRLLLLAVGVLALAALAYAVSFVNNYPRTDDAFVQTDTIGVASQVSGRIVALKTRDNAMVAKR